MAAPRTVAVIAGFPLVGRADALRTLECAVERGRNLLLVGPIGVGKTRLLEELVALAIPVVELVEIGSPAPDGLAAAGATSIERRGDWPRRLHAEADRHRRTSSGPVTCVVVVEHAHHLDTTTRRQIRAVASAPWNVTIATSLDGPAAPDATDLLGPDASTLFLGPLDQAAVLRLAALVTGFELDRLTSSELLQRSRGLPLCVIELLLGARELGAADPMTPDARAIGRLPVHRLADIVSARLREAGGPAGDCAELLAFGSPLPMAVIAASGVREGYRMLHRHGLVTTTTEAGTSTVQLGHPIYGEALRATIPPTRRTELLTRLTAAFDRVGVPPQERVSISSWRLEVAGDSPRQFELAACEAYGVGKYAIAAHLADDAMIGDPGALEELCGYRRVLRALGGSLDVVEDDAVEDDAVEDVTAVEDVAAGGGGTSEARGPRGRLLRAVADALTGAGQLDPGRVARAVAAGTRTTAEGARALPLGSDLIAQAAVIVQLDDGPLQPLISAVERRFPAARAWPMSDAPAGWLATLGRLHLAMGDIDAARADLGHAAAALLEVDSIGRRPSVLANLAWAAAHAGDIYAVVDAITRIGPDRDTRTSVHVPCALATAYVGTGDADTVTVVEAAAARASADHHHRWELAAWHLLVRAGYPERAVAPLERLSTITGAPAVSLALRHARASRDGQAPALVELAHVYAAAGRRLIAAEIAADAARSDAARSDAARADAARSDAAGRARALAAGLLATCPGADVPLLRGYVPAKLTTQQRVVARLAVQAHSDEVIASRLNLSHRTVGNHLGRVYRTLGVSGRRQLASTYAGSPLFAVDEPRSRVAVSAYPCRSVDQRVWRNVREQARDPDLR